MKESMEEDKRGLLIIVVVVVICNIIFFGGLYKISEYRNQKMEAQWELEDQIYKDGYEKGRFDELNETAMERSCFNISKNTELNLLLEKHFKNCADAKLMWAIAQAESSGKQTAIGKNTNGSVDCGWLQINTIHRKKGETKESFCYRMHDLEQNIATAKLVKDKQGLSAWVTYNTGKYLTYLK